MKRQHTYEQIIGHKLNSLTAPDAAGLWSSMEAILDKEMPQQEERKRRGGAWWGNTNMLIAASLLVAVGSVYTFYQVSGKTPFAQSTAGIISTEKTGTIRESVAKSAATTGHKSTTGSSASPSSEKETAVVKNVAGISAVGEVKAVSNERRKITAAKPGSINGVAPVADQDHKILAGETNILSAETEIANLSTALMGEVELEKAVVPSAFDQREVKAIATAIIVAENNKHKKARVFSDKGLTAGISLNYSAAINSQVRNELDMSGKQNKWQDYLPSVYVQYHLNKKFYVQAEWQPVAPQYTPGFTLYNRIDELNPDEKEQKVVKLNKLFYTNVPVSFHYKTPLKNVTVGMGVQYSKMKKMILQDQEYYHLIQAGGVFEVEERKNEVVVKDPETVRNHSSTGDLVDSVARSFNSADWRLLADVGYQYKGFNLGIRYTSGLKNYINSNFTNLPVKDRNEAVQVYLRFNLFDSRKK